MYPDNFKKESYRRLHQMSYIKYWGRIMYQWRQGL
ncbi:unnamed protein product [Linum tenue]|uniref:Uncharacterized protein n=1 Tax=Linum tenue TaxID=586396 RepID=A0AAV0MN73_9ROSI|nr:unnamed protein product [Linum tenue]